MGFAHLKDREGVFVSHKESHLGGTTTHTNNYSCVENAIDETEGRIAIAFDVSTMVPLHLTRAACQTTVDATTELTTKDIARSVIAKLQEIVMHRENTNVLVSFVADEKSIDSSIKIDRLIRGRKGLTPAPDLAPTALYHHQESLSLPPDANIVDWVKTEFGKWPAKTLIECPNVWELGIQFPVIRACIMRSVMLAIASIVEEEFESTGIETGAVCITVPSVPVLEPECTLQKEEDALKDKLSPTEAQGVASEFLRTTAKTQTEHYKNASTHMITCSSPEVIEGAKHNNRFLALIIESSHTSYIPTDTTPYTGEADLTMFTTLDIMKNKFNMHKNYTQIIWSVDSDAIATECLRMSDPTIRNKPLHSFIHREIKTKDALIKKNVEIQARPKTRKLTLAHIMASACMGTDYVSKAAFQATARKSNEKFVAAAIKFVHLLTPEDLEKNRTVVKNMIIAGASHPKSQNASKSTLRYDAETLAETVSDFVQYMSPNMST
jgi:hypothetical protein